MTITATNAVDASAAAKRGRGTRRNPVSVSAPAGNAGVAPTATTKPPSKSAAVIELLSRPKGATLPEMMAVTDWQPHSVRAYLSGLRKKDSSLAREARKDGEQAYRLMTSAADAADQSKPATRLLKVKGADEAAPASVDLTNAPLPPATMPAATDVA